ncbi:hypothetical protein H7170_03860 [Candidatus Gracilibacteria bacterium]|nr:hypothetical protein [Candidatus Gracilibacteria bacterium]
MNQSTTGTSGIHAKSAESSRRFMETLGAKPSEILVFQTATQQQIIDAIREEEIYYIPATIDLAKQGLYDPNNTATIFHPQYSKWLDSIIDKPNDGTAITFGRNGTFSIQRVVLEGVLAQLRTKPSLMYVN